MTKFFPFLVAIFSLMNFTSIVLADDALFRTVISKNNATVDGRYYLDLEMRVTNGSDKDLNSLTVDVFYGDDLTAWTADPDSDWFSTHAGYVRSVSKLSGRYRVLVTGDYNDIGAGNFWSVTSSWQKVVTLRWKIATVTAHNCTVSDTTDATAFFVSSDVVNGWTASNTDEASVLVKTKIFLEGPYNATNHEMTTSLNSGGYIPNTSPYAEDERTVASIPADVTDWVLVQVRSEATGNAMASQSAFLHKDGRIVADDGTTETINVDETSGDYYLVIKHRNHLAVMSKNNISLNTSTADQYNFTSAITQFYGDDAKELETNVYGMYGGDINQDGNVTVSDNNIIMNNRNDEGYEDGDINLDGNVTVSDNNKCMNNRNKGTQVP